MKIRLFISPLLTVCALSCSTETIVGNSSEESLPTRNLTQSDANITLSGESDFLVAGISFDEAIEVPIEEEELNGLCHKINQETVIFSMKNQSYWLCTEQPNPIHLSGEAPSMGDHFMGVAKAHPQDNTEDSYGSIPATHYIFISIKQVSSEETPFELHCERHYLTESLTSTEQYTSQQEIADAEFICGSEEMSVTFNNGKPIVEILMETGQVVKSYNLPLEKVDLNATQMALK